MEGIVQGRSMEAVEAYTGDRYTQHSTRVKDGREGFIEFFTDFIERNPKRHIEIVRGWEDGRYVFLHAFQSLNDGEHQYVTTDFFDTDDEGKIIEHWDVIGEFKGLNPSGRTQVDGTTEITELDRTEENKAIVKEMLEKCLFAGARPDRIEDYFGEDYLQHNPNQEIPCRTGDFGGGQGRRRSVDLWFFRPIEDVASRFSTGHGVPFRWVCELQRDVVKPGEFAEWHLEGTRETVLRGAWGKHRDCCSEGCRASQALSRVVVRSTVLGTALNDIEGSSCRDRTLSRW